MLWHSPWGYKMDSVIIPINEEIIAEIIFENSENIPNDIYINLMKLMKDYHHNKQNGQEVKEYLNLNKTRIDNRVYKQISNQIKKPKKIKLNIYPLDYLKLCSFITKFIMFGVVIVTLFGMATVLIFCLVTKKNTISNYTNNTILVNLTRLNITN